MPTSNAVFHLPGGNEDNDLWAELRQDDDRGWPMIVSVWELDPEERAALAAGGTIELVMWSQEQVPVSLAVGPSIAEHKATPA